MENSPRRSLPLNVSDLFFGAFYPPVSNFVHTGQKISTQNRKTSSKSASSDMNHSEKMDSSIEDSATEQASKSTFFQGIVGVFDSITNMVSKISNYTNILSNTLSVTVVPNDDIVSSEFLLQNLTVNNQDLSSSKDNLAKMFGNTTNKSMCDVNNHVTQVFTTHQFKNLNLVNTDNTISSERIDFIHDEEHYKNLIKEKNDLELAIEESLKHMKNYNSYDETDSNFSNLGKNHLNVLTNNDKMLMNSENIISENKSDTEQWIELDNLVDEDKDEKVFSKKPRSLKMRKKSNIAARYRGKGRNRIQLRKSGVSQLKHRKERIKQNIYSNIQEDLNVWEKEQNDSSEEQSSIISSSTDDENQNNDDYVCDMKIEYPTLIESFRLGDSLSINDKEEEKSLENLTHSCDESDSTFSSDSRRLSQCSVESDDSCFIVFEDESADEDDDESTDEEDSKSTDYSDDDSTDSDSDSDNQDEVDGGLKPGLQVRFNLKPTIHTIIKWDYAYRAARKGPWEEFARDRERFWGRIRGMGKIIEPILKKEHRDCIWENRFAIKDESM
ncbi:protein PFC0760c-like [Chelonus insularis]|uniref:protein PFC0760c-like n=1 Tax=Chelonus insularis TaxID=460826 RepID=UPI00158CFF4A|nr:protein PFC0760c-like [Chelonus insularis]XP_034935662.1 protein PFC0760c-like [Chelonus insularis]